MNFKNSKSGGWQSIYEYHAFVYALSTAILPEAGLQFSIIDKFEFSRTRINAYGIRANILKSVYNSYQVSHDSIHQEQLSFGHR